jgi:hypothetical protein
MKYEVRACTEITFDFEIEAKSDVDAENQVKKLLPYIEHGKLDNQPVSVKCGKGQKLRSLFIMEVQCEDINEIE